MFAAPGYAVVAINPRGSTGYGQKFTDQISQDWTGRVYDDLMKGLDHALKTYPFLDETEVAAAGGSYGGFMVNWIAGHTDRFKALISHAGRLRPDEQVRHDRGALVPRVGVRRHALGASPSTTASSRPAPSSANFKTPTLVIHGALDFRVPDAQGLGMFTCAPAPGRPQPLRLLPRRGPLDRQAPEPGRLVARGAGVAGAVPEVSGCAR